MKVQLEIIRTKGIRIKKIEVVEVDNKLSKAEAIRVAQLEWLEDYINRDEVNGFKETIISVTQGKELAGVKINASLIR